MRRQIYKDLLAWKKSGMKKPLMIIGARQIGKTYTIKKFLENECNNFLYFNLFEEEEIVSIFSEKININEKLKKFELYLNQKIDYKNTILFFDEAQVSEELISHLKFFAESSTAYKIILAGSLLGVKINRFKKAFPVGKVKIINMYPMNFYEFLLAKNEESLVDEIKNCFDNEKEMIDSLHRKCIALYRTYAVVGGMPEAVKNALEIESLLCFDKSILTDIRKAYLNDMNKYIEAAIEKTRIETIYNSIPSQLGNKSGKFQYSKIKKGARSRDYILAKDWLLSSSMIYETKLITAPKHPLKIYEQDDFFKIYLSDNGLLNNLMETSFNKFLLGDDFFAKGIIVENYIATQFASVNIPLRFWKSNNTAEVDFLLDTNVDGVVPIEVKAGVSIKSKSLSEYIKKFNPKYAIRISEKNFGFANGIKSVPLYAVFCITQN